jgi:hypothetical protein
LPTQIASAPGTHALSPQYSGDPSKHPTEALGHWNAAPLQ